MAAAVRPRMCFLGAPGVGKGTYASRVAKRLGIPTISTGDLLRAEVAKKTPLGKALDGYAKSGQLAPDKLIMDMVADELSRSPKGYLLDGYPRTLSQAEHQNRIDPLNLVVNIVLEEKYLVQKILGRRVCPSCKKSFNLANIDDPANGVLMPPLLPKSPSPELCECGTKLEQRADDTEPVIKHRLQVYNDQTAPLISYYTQKGVLVDFVVKKGLDDLPKLNAIIDQHFAGRK